MFSDLEIQTVYYLERFRDNTRLVNFAERLLKEIDDKAFKDHRRQEQWAWMNRPYNEAAKISGTSAERRLMLDKSNLESQEKTRVCKCL